MQSRKTSWLIMMFLIALMSFLVAFQPVRRPVKKGPVNSAFKFSVPQSLGEAPADLQKKQDEIEKALTTEGIKLDHVKVQDKNTIEVETLAFTEKQKTEDETKVTQFLGKQYQGLKEIQQPAEQAEEEQPLFSLGSALAVYHPKLNIRLGLDLQGGAHVVLRCLPSVKMVFKSPEDKPMVAPESLTPGSAEAPSSSKLQTGQGLTGKIKAQLIKNGVAADEINVQMVSPSMLSVETRANDDATVRKQQTLIYDYLRDELATSLKPDEIEKVKPDATFVTTDTSDKVKNILDRRLYSMSEIREPVIQKQGNDRMIVELPGVKDPDRVVDLIKSTAQLEFRLIPARYDHTGAKNDYSEWQDKQSGMRIPWERVYAESDAEFTGDSKFTGKDLESDASVVPGQAGDWQVKFNMKSDQKRRFDTFTGRNVGRLMAIVLDGKCQMAPVIKSRLPGSGVIEGNFNAQDARDLKLLLNAGALPVPLEIAERRTVSATLGQDAITKSLTAGYIGLGLVLLFMIGFYRLPGFMADVALALYCLIVFAVLVIANTTLTLPGIAGVILSIGMAVDANVIIFERLKEELWSGKPMRAAIDAGFKRAWTAILDANVTTLITCSVLYFLGTSVIKSFAVTLFIGVAASLFTAVTVSYWLVSIVADTRYGQSHHLYGVRMPTGEGAE